MFGVTSGALPTGMSLGSAGTVSGTPGSAGTFNFTVTSSDEHGCTGSRAYTLTILTNGQFTDDPLTAGVTVVRAVHIRELRTRIDALRARVNRSPYAWTDPTLVAGSTVIRAQHILDLRSALSEVYISAGLTPPVYTDSSLAGVTVKMVHIAELRAAVIAIE